MASEQRKRQYIIAGTVLLNLLSSLLFGKYKQQLPQSLKDVPFILAILIPVIGFTLVYIVSYKDKKFALLMIPLTVIVLAIFTFLWEHF